jgi:hypothetical protein
MVTPDREIPASSASLEQTDNACLAVAESFQRSVWAAVHRLVDLLFDEFRRAFRAGVRQGAGFGSPPETLASQQDESVDDEEGCGRGRPGEDDAEDVLEQKAGDSHRDRLTASPLAVLLIFCALILTSAPATLSREQEAVGFWFIGCSMGGGIAIDFTVEHSERVWPVVPVAAALSGVEETHEERERWGSISHRCSWSVWSASAVAISSKSRRLRSSIAPP